MTGPGTNTYLVGEHERAGECAHAVVAGLEPADQAVAAARRGDAEASGCRAHEVGLDLIALRGAAVASHCISVIAHLSRAIDEPIAAERDGLFVAGRRVEDDHSAVERGWFDEAAANVDAAGDAAVWRTTACSAGRATGAEDLRSRFALAAARRDEEKEDPRRTRPPQDQRLHA